MTEAFLVHEGMLYFAKGNPGLALDTAVSVLIHGIWARHPARAFSILRERIHTNYPLTPVCAGAIKVGAKRSTVHSSSEYELALKRASASLPLIARSGSQTEQVFLGPRQDGFLAGPDADAWLSDQMRIAPTGALDEGQASGILRALLGRSTAEKPVAAVLFGPGGRILGASWNTSEVNRAAHAEYNLIRGYLLDSGGLQIARGASLWVSLRPCALCAGAIFSASEEVAGLRVRFLKDDPGPASKNSCLVPHSDLWRRAGGPRIDVALSPS